MGRPVDEELVARFVLRETDDRETAEVKRLVREDPAWAAALQREAALDVAIFEALDLAAKPAVAAAPARRRAWWPALLPVLAFAAAALLWVGSPEPRYTLEVHGGEAAVRGSAEETLRWTEASVVDLVLRVDAPTDAAPAVAVLLDGQPVEGVRVERLPGGSIRVVGRFGAELPTPSPGPHLLIVDVGGASHALPFTWTAPR